VSVCDETGAVLGLPSLYFWYAVRNGSSHPVQTNEKVLQVLYRHWLSKPYQSFNRNFS